MALLPMLRVAGLSAAPVRRATGFRTAAFRAAAVTDDRRERALSSVFDLLARLAGLRAS